MDIELGDKVKCKITGFEGRTVARTEFINGCIQYEVQPPYDKKTKKIPDGVGIDAQSLIVVEKVNKPKKKRKTGGANTTSKNMRGF